MTTNRGKSTEGAIPLQATELMGPSLSSTIETRGAKELIRAIDSHEDTQKATELELGHCHTTNTTLAIEIAADDPCDSGDKKEATSNNKEEEEEVN